MGRFSSNSKWDYDWEKMYNDELFSSCGDDKKLIETIENNINKAYNSKSASKCSSINELVDAAIQSGNHSAFARVYVELEKKRKYFLADTLSKYLEQVKIKDILLVKPDSDALRAPEFEFPDSTSEFRKDYKKLIVSKNAIYSWGSGDNTPKRDAVIQLGFYLGLDAKQVDELLLLSGHNRLYSLDICDIVLRFYLNYFAVSESSGYEKLKYTKRKINEYLARYANDGTSFVYAKNKYGYSVPYLRKAINETDIAVSDIKKDIITVRYENKFNNCKKDSVWSEDVFDKAVRESISELTYLHYGLVRMTAEFVSDIPAVMKNNRYSAIGLVENAVPKKEDVVSSNVAELKAKNKEEKIKKLLWENWTRNNHIEEIFFSKEENMKRYGKRTVVYFMISGRDIKVDVDSGEENVHKFEMQSKKSVILFSLCAGKEDMAVEYLRHAGYLNPAINYDAIDKFIDETSDINEIVKINEIFEKGYDELDLLLAYSIRYKEALIKKWVEKWGEKDDKISMNAANEAFPFMKLVNVIVRDIQVVKLYGDEGSKSASDSSTGETKLVIDREAFVDNNGIIRFYEQGLAERVKVFCNNKLFGEINRSYARWFENFYGLIYESEK